MSAQSDLSYEELVRRFHVPEDAEFGEVVMFGVGFPAVRWVEDGAHMVASTEVNLSGQGDNWDEAFESFFLAAGDLGSHLVELVSREEATEYERETLSVLAPRLAEIFERMSSAFEVLERRRLNLRRRSQRLKSWRSPQTPPNSSRLLPV